MDDSCVLWLWVWVWLALYKQEQSPDQSQRAAEAEPETFDFVVTCHGLIGLESGYMYDYDWVGLA